MSDWFTRLRRLVHHRWTEGQVAQAFPAEVLEQLELAISASETQHTGQVRLCIEGGLPYSYIWRNASAHERALNLFGKLRVWDTEANNGVLIYLLLADHAIEVIADRAIARAVPTGTWHSVIAHMQAAFQQGLYTEGTLSALDQVTAVLKTHFPHAAHEGPYTLQDPPSTLPDTPVVQGRFFKDL